MSRFVRVGAMALSALAVVAAAAMGQAARSPAHRAAQSLDQLKDFDGVALGGPDRVLVRHGAAFAVTVEGDPQAIAQLDIYVENHVLHVDRRDLHRRWSRPDRGATVHVTLPQLRSASLDGSGDLSIDRMDAERVEASIAGSGNLAIDGMKARQARLAVAGSGTLTARGAVQDTRLSLAGSGDIRADRLDAVTADVAISGSGNAYLRASRGVTASIAGSGDATVHGTTNCRLNRVGSGDLHCSA